MKLWSCEIEIFYWIKRFFTMLCFVQNDTVLFCTQELEIWTISVFKRKDFFILIMFLRKQSWRNSFAMKRGENDAGYEVRVKRCEYFYHKVHGVMVKWWRFWGLWGTLEIVKMWSWNILLFEEILHYAVLRSEWHGSVLYSRIRNMNYQCF